MEIGQMKLTPGSRWKSAVCDTEIVLVRQPKAGELQCGGREMVPHNATKPEGLALSLEYSSGTQLGKRYGDDAGGIEVLCTKPGRGSLALDGRALVMREAKKLPSSD